MDVIGEKGITAYIATASERLVEAAKERSFAEIIGNLDTADDAEKLIKISGLEPEKLPKDHDSKAKDNMRLNRVRLSNLIGKAIAEGKRTRSGRTLKTG